jgi:hypothetical protein
VLYPPVFQDCRSRAWLCKIMTGCWTLGERKEVLEDWHLPERETNEHNWVCTFFTLVCLYFHVWSVHESFALLEILTQLIIYLFWPVKQAALEVLGHWVIVWWPQPAWKLIACPLRHWVISLVPALQLIIHQTVCIFQLHVHSLVHCRSLTERKHWICFRIEDGVPSRWASTCKVLLL